MRVLFTLFAAAFVLSSHPASAEEDYASWPLLTSTFPSTGGGGYIIKGYDPVIIGGKCITTFMATLPPNELYLHMAEYEAVPAQGGTLCTNGRWRAKDGSANGTTPYRVFIKDGVVRGSP